LLTTSCAIWTIMDDHEEKTLNLPLWESNVTPTYSLYIVPKGMYAEILNIFSPDSFHVFKYTHTLMLVLP